MRTRKEVAEYINSGKCEQDARERYPETLTHFGKCELKCLMDFAYECLPEEDEFITWETWVSK